MVHLEYFEQKVKTSSFFVFPACLDHPLGPEKDKGFMILTLLASVCDEMHVTIIHSTNTHTAVGVQQR